VSEHSKRDDIEEGIGAMSTWNGGETRLWEAALNQAGTRGRFIGALGGLKERVPAPAVAALLVAAVGFGVVLGGVVGYGGSVPDGVLLELDNDGLVYSTQASTLDDQVSFGFAAEAFDMQRGRDRSSAGRQWAPARAASGVALMPADAMGQDLSDDVRQIAYSATVALESDDVRALIDRLRALVDTEAGEFVEGVSIAGEGGDANGRVTLRVRGERLEDVLTQVRALGAVLSEEVSAQDLTNQLVDTGARLRNERRVETELLELMETHDRLDLAGLVRLRKELGEVRGRIESMDASRMNMERLVSLASVRVSVRGRDVQPEMRVESGWERFWSGVRAYWSDGVGRLGRSMGGLLSFAVGRVLWWVPGLVLLAVAWRLWRRSGARA